ncbi:phage tail protein [Enterobacter cloacae]|uniref:phage tail protein n=1 Tax=Enterobacter cloacae TaxID=550 RepID=UPI002A7F5F36|nr:phage tail protein [Enterobacter cloacae]
MAEKYYSILTNRGKELEAQSSATGKPVIIKDFVVGDGNGQPVKPDPAQTKLVREVYRNAISALQVSPDQANQFIAQLVLAAGVGGFVVREVGLLTDAGELYSVANCAAIEKPENGVSVNLQYRLAVSETANIELKVATGDGLFLRIDKNLSEIAAKGQAAQKSAREALEVVDATISRKGLVQLSSATNSTSEALGATPKAVKVTYDLADTANKAAKAANDNADSRLLKSSNLSDVPDKVKARDALELKTAATRDVTTSSYDTTAGRVLKVGDFGQGTANGLALLNSIFDITCAAKYSALGVGAGASATQGMPANSGNTRFSVEVDSIYTNQYWVTLRSSSQTYTGMVNTENKTASWTQYYTESNKPAASDVDAVSASQGGVFQRQVQFSQGLRLQNAEYLAGINYGTDSASFSGANLLLKSWYGIGFYSNYPSSSELGIMGYINVRIGRLEMKEQIIPGNYANFDARYQAKGNYTPAGQAYTKAESDGRFQPKGDYTPAGQAYTKAESNARFIQGFRLGAQGTANNGNNVNNFADAPNGASVTGVQQNTDYVQVKYRYNQYNLNGTWYNAGVAQ